jgi:hypothetical protein
MNKEHSYHEGGCACGEVRYRLLNSPMIVHACHCRNCQRQTGAWHAVNALIESHEVELLRGRLSISELATPTGAGQSIARCPTCGVAVWSNYHAFSQGHGDIVRFVRVGTLDEPDELSPDVHIFNSARNAGAPEPIDAPQYEAFYRLQDVWTPDNLQRYYALLQQ